MTADEAAEWGKSLNFEKVWAILAEVGQKQAEAAEQFREVSQKQAEAAEQSRETDRILTRAAKRIENLSKNIGGVNRSLGRWVEQMVASKLWVKFNALGYAFTKGGKNIKFWENERTIAESDVFLENGEYVMSVETKTELTVEDVDEHQKRIEKIRAYMNSHGDSRIIVGSVAGAIVPDNVCRYAQEKGFYVLMQSGDSVAVAETPEGFEPRTW